VGAEFYGRVFGDRLTIRRGARRVATNFGIDATNVEQEAIAARGSQKGRLASGNEGDQVGERIHETLHRGALRRCRSGIGHHRGRDERGEEESAGG